MRRGRSLLCVLWKRDRLEELQRDWWNRTNGTNGSHVPDVERSLPLPFLICGAPFVNRENDGNKKRVKCRLRKGRAKKKKEKCIEIENSCDWSSCWRRGLKSPYIMPATSIRSSSSQMIWALELSDIFFCQSSFTSLDPSCFVAPLCFWSLIAACSESHKKIEETTNIYTSSIAETSGWSITQQRLNQSSKEKQLWPVPLQEQLTIKSTYLQRLP